ncbi:MAG: hypothetical protein JW841_00590 [Deltaproteobacteria bacterium]|nr:hypothetical protein [Deltaproteobacteria bacterium]
MCLQQKPNQFRRNFFGITSVILIYTALTIGIIFSLQHSLWLGITCIAISAFWLLPVAWLFCRKCPVRLNCPHVILGSITKTMPPTVIKPYSRFELFGTLIAILVFVITPQYGLWPHKFWLLLFWIFIAIAAIMARLGLCPTCEHKNCPFKNH